ncbi:transmembrane protein 100-like [Rhinatrema bivittatum]|uniref:transmembrane protein 100-like n=1 Tax=Rhinatrema bivittatum TaxID=194408 RepID=UPI00112BEA3A|nr:transmembrane protein 100-like [Rhinatrema bivittatum]XP_029441491.1 transmembrane protein 100-like [Rhinatrema bivittatum]
MAQPPVTLTALTALPHGEATADVPSEDVAIRRWANPHLVNTVTGGLEHSCHSCLLAFGLVTTLIGVVTTSVAYVRDSHGSVIATLGLILLASGLAASASSCLWSCCRKTRRGRKESFSMLVCEQQEKKMTV